MAKVKADDSQQTVGGEQPNVVAIDNAMPYAPREGLPLKFACAEFGNVDLSTMTLSLAEQLYEKGYLIKKVV